MLPTFDYGYNGDNGALDYVKLLLIETGFDSKLIYIDPFHHHHLA